MPSHVGRVTESSLAVQTPPLALEPRSGASRSRRIFRLTRALVSGIGRLGSIATRAGQGPLAVRSDATITFFTIGHSTRTIVEFVDLLRESSVELVIDVGSIPRSRTNPQFNQETLPGTLEPWQIGYQYIAELGGLRGKVARR